MDFTGRVESHDGKVIFSRVSGSIAVGNSSWVGTLAVDSGETPQMFDGVLVVDGAARGRAIATRLDLPSGIIDFRGGNPPPINQP